MHEITPIMIIGVQKAGTTSLFDILSIAGEIAPCDVKEPAFFNSRTHYKKGIGTYLSHYSLFDQRFILEATPAYLYSRQAPKRIKKYFPSPFFIILLRNPVERAYSAWNMYRTMYLSNPRLIWDRYFQNADWEVKRGFNKLFFSSHFPSFGEMVQKELRWMRMPFSFPEPSIVRRGLYSEQIRNYLDYFGPERMIVAEQRAFFSDLDCNVKKISSLIGISEIQIYSTTCSGQKLNAGDYPEISPPEKETVKALEEFYKPYLIDLHENVRPVFGRNWID
jgi:hypothetical protein